MWKFKQEVRKAQERDPDFVRLEGINIIELDGLSASAMSSETMEVIRLASKISDFFPETLHCMLVLNAPSFFAMTWGIIKKFIDPRTAARIQLFANRERGEKALEKLVDKSEIPSDYGGSNISLKEAFLREAADPSLLRQEIELLHCKRKGKANTKTWTLEKSETMQVTVYTRSVSPGHVTIQLNGLTFRSFDVQCLFSGNGDNNENDTAEDHAVNSTRSTDPSALGTPLPNQVTAKNLVGPGKVTVEVNDLDTAAKHHSGMSRGYFLVVGDVKKLSVDKPKAKLQQQQKVTVTMAGLSTTPGKKDSAKKQRTSGFGLRKS